MPTTAKAQSTTCNQCGSTHRESIYECHTCGRLKLGDDNQPQLCTRCDIPTVKVLALGCGDCDDAGCSVATISSDLHTSTSVGQAGMEAAETPAQQYGSDPVGKE